MSGSVHRECRTGQGFTLVELLVVIGIIGVLVGLLLPAVQAAREAARRAQCKSHLRQLALAALTHNEAHGHFPTGGWGRTWAGDKDRGFGQAQPGNWAFNLLPFLEEKSAYDLAGDGQPDVITPEQREGAARLIEQAFEVFNCPSRRASIPYPTDYPRNVGHHNMEFTEVSGKLDYAASSGDHQYARWNTGPSKMSEWEIYFCNGKTGRPQGDCSLPFSPLTGEPGYHGVSFQASEVRMRHITDGTAKTYLIGEKYVDAANYHTNLDWGDNRAWCTGFAENAYRSGFDPPLQDRQGLFGPERFGSAHSAGIHMAFCDGSVRVVSYDVERTVHMAGANRHDGSIDGVGATIVDEANEPPPFR